MTAPRWTIIALAAYFLLTMLVGWFHTLHGDEGLWLYQIGLLAKGLLPGVDFITQEPLGLFGPYALAIALISPSVEAVRLVQVLLMTIGNGAVAWLAWTRWGRMAGIAAFLLLAFNVPYATDSVVFTSQASAYLAIAVIFVILMAAPRPNWRHYLIAGLLIGFAIATRLALALVALSVAAHAMMSARGHADALRRGLGRATIAAIAAIIVCLPDVLLVAKSAQNQIFMRFGAAGAMSRIYELREGWTAGPPLSVEIKARLATIADYLTLSVYHDVGQNLLLVVILAASLGYALAARALPRLPRLGWPDREIRWAALFILPILAGYAAAPWSFQVPGYLIATYPLSVIIMVGLGATLVARLQAAGPDFARPRQWMKAGIILLVGLHTLQGVAHGAWQVLFRNAASLGQPLTVARLACWVEEATSPDEQILSLHPILAMLSHRRVPTGLEAGAQLKYWYQFPTEKTGSLPLMSPESLRSLIAQESVPVIVDDSQFESVYLRVPQLAGFSALLADHYINVGRFGGELFPMTVHVSKRWLARRPAPLPPFPVEEGTKTRMSALRSGSLETALGAIASDIARSLGTLPRDIRQAFARLAGASHAARCEP